MSANKKTKVFKLNGEDVTATHVSELNVKLGVFRDIENEKTAGTMELMRYITGKDEEFIYELGSKDISKVIEWATVL